MREIDIDAVEFCGLIEFAEKYEGCQFYYVKDGERKYISSQDAYEFYLCPKYGMQ